MSKLFPHRWLTPQRPPLQLLEAQDAQMQPALSEGMESEEHDEEWKLQD
jgi:hypothetical protein